jgi:predicted RNase H-like HicB family nuclease
LENEYDFSSGERGAVVPDPARITLRLDNDVLDWFRAEVEASGGGDYRSLIRAALRDHVQQRHEPLEATLRRVIREELRREAFYTAVIQHEGEYWIGWIEEVPGVNSQGATRDELMENLRSALREALEMETPGEIAARWTDEAQRGYEELRSGEVEGVPAEDVLARIRLRLGLMATPGSGPRE